MMDVAAQKRIKAKNALVQFGIACVYVDCLGWETATYCNTPRWDYPGELERWNAEGQERVRLIKVLIDDVPAHAKAAGSPKRNDVIKIAEDASAEWCGTYTVTRALPHDRVICQCVVR